MKVSTRFTENCKEAVVAFSGGADSVALLHWLKYNTDIKLTAVHVNHQINTSSTDWELFCRDFCKDHDIRFFSAKANIDASKNLEANARDARYKILAEFPQRWVFTAHHADDQTETFFLKLLRGSGIQGLTGIREQQYMSSYNGMFLIRPLLCTTKSEIYVYLQDHGLEYVVDPSNSTIEQDRNKFRNVIIPEIQKYFPSFNKSLIRSINAIRDANICLEELAQLDIDRTADLIDGEFVFRIEDLKELFPHRIRNLILYILKDEGLSVSCKELEQFSVDIQWVTWDNKLELSCKLNGKVTKKLKQTGKKLWLQNTE